MSKKYILNSTFSHRNSILVIDDPHCTSYIREKLDICPERIKNKVLPAAVWTSSSSVSLQQTDAQQKRKLYVRIYTSTQKKTTKSKSHSHTYMHIPTPSFLFHMFFMTLQHSSDSQRLWESCLHRNFLFVVEKIKHFCRAAVVPRDIDSSHVWFQCLWPSSRWFDLTDLTQAASGCLQLHTSHSHIKVHLKVMLAPASKYFLHQELCLLFTGL